MQKVDKKNGRVSDSSYETRIPLLLYENVGCICVCCLHLILPGQDQVNSGEFTSCAVLCSMLAAFSLFS